MTEILALNVGVALIEVVVVKLTIGVTETLVVGDLVGAERDGNSDGLNNVESETVTDVVTELLALNVGLALFEVVVVLLPLTLTEEEVHAVDDRAGDLVNNGDRLFVEVVEID